MSILQEFVLRKFVDKLKQNTYVYFFKNVKDSLNIFQKFLEGMPPDPLVGTC